MANIRKMEPSRQMRNDDPFQTPFDDFFRGLFVHPMRFGPRSDQLRLPSTALPTPSRIPSVSVMTCPM